MELTYQIYTKELERYVNETLGGISALQNNLMNVDTVTSHMRSFARRYYPTNRFKEANEISKMYYNRYVKENGLV